MVTLSEQSSVPLNQTRMVGLLESQCRTARLSKQSSRAATVERIWIPLSPDILRLMVPAPRRETRLRREQLGSCLDPFDHRRSPFTCKCSHWLMRCGWDFVADDLWLVHDYSGSVKTNIGHLESGSGIAALIKVVLSLEKGVIPPVSENFQTVNPALDLDFSNLKVHTIVQNLSLPGH